MRGLHQLRKRVGGLAVALVVVVLWPAAADAYCVNPNSSPSLWDRLVQWSTSDDTTITIDLEQGTYNINGGLNPAGAGHACCGSDGHNAGLVLRGGYVPGTGCKQRAHDASLTTLNGAGANGGFLLYFNGPMTISTLTFQNYQNSNGVMFFGFTGTDNPVHADNIIGNANTTVFLQGSAVTLRNALIYGATSSLDAALGITATSQSAVLTNLTVAGNAGPGLSLANQFGGNVPVAAYNSIFWANHAGKGGEDVIGYDATDNNALQVHSAILTNTDIPAANQHNVTNKDPFFVNGYHLSTDALAFSPAINVGTTNVTLTSTDIAGLPRIQGGAPDFGAYESNSDFAKTYIVTTTVDNGSNASPTLNSLRWAIVSARTDAHSKAASANPKYLISFGLLPASGQLCPPVMAVTTNAYPDIDFDVTIDGYTQQHTSPNTKFQGFDAVLCVSLAGNGNISHAFQTIDTGTRAGRLTLRGLRVGGFTDAAIKLNGGGGHLIQGNQIGGVSVSPLGLFGENNDGVRITGGTGTSFVGAYDDPATRNMIIDNTRAGVFIDSFTSSSTPGSYVVNNLIGLGADGVSAVGNGYGIFINGTPRNIIEYDTIGESVHEGLTISGSSAQFNIVQDNRIGLNEADPAMGASNGSYAILLNNGAANNMLGASHNSSYGGNAIASTAASIYMSNSAGAGNLAAANSFFVSGALPLDLGATGPTPNDPPADLDSDTGPDDLQNHPTNLRAYRTKTYEWIEGDLDTFANESLRLDFYFTPAAAGGYTPYLFFGRASSGLTDANGHVHFWARVLAPDSSAPLSQVSAAATATNGDTSELSALVVESGDMIFRDDFDPHF